MSLKGQVAVVTGASRGIGKGIALRLGQAGATVYVTGRRPQEKSKGEQNLPGLEQCAKEINERGGKGIAVYCDHSKADEVEKLFQFVETKENGQLDILVNNAYAAVMGLIRPLQSIVSNASKKFWELEPSEFEAVNNVGLQNHYICSVYAARLMVKRGKGLIVIVSSVGGLMPLFNVAYGIGKQACDRMAADMGKDLKASNVACISLWPGAVKTEVVQTVLKDPSEIGMAAGTKAAVKQIWDRTPSESTEMSGIALVALASDKNLMEKSGQIITTAQLAEEFGLKDIDGTVPAPRMPPAFKQLFDAQNAFRKALL